VAEKSAPEPAPEGHSEGVAEPAPAPAPIAPPPGRQYFGYLIYKRTLDGHERGSYWLDADEIQIPDLSRPVPSTDDPATRTAPLPHTRWNGGPSTAS
jgi:hypothetical protein